MKGAIWSAPPGFAAAEEVLRRASDKRGSMIVSSNISLLAQIRDAAARSEKVRESYESGALQIKALHEIVRMFADAAGVPLATIAGPEHQAALLGKVCGELGDESPFARARYLPGFHKALVSTLREMRHARVEPSEAVNASPKLREIATIDEKFRALMLSHRLTTLSDRIEKTLVETPIKPAELSQLYWIGETEFDPLLLDFARWVMSSGVGITFIVEEHLGDERFFGTLSALRHALPSLQVKRLGIKALVGSRLFGDVDIIAPSRVVSIRMADDFVETEWVVAEIAKRIANGASPASLCIYAKTLDRYGPLLHAASLRAQIPLAMVRRERIETNSFAQQVLGALRASVSGAMADVAPIATSVYAGIPKHQREEVATAVRQCRKAEDQWNALREASLHGDVPNWLARYAAWREKARSLRLPLTEWVRGLDVLISSSPWLEAGTPDDNAAQDAMIRALSVRKFAEGTREIPLDEFVAICAECWRDADYSIRSTFGVRVIASPFSVGQASALFVLGAIESSVPGRRAEDPVLLDKDRAALTDQNKAWVLPTSYDIAKESRRDFYRLMCSCADIVITYPARVDENDEVESAFVDELVKGGIVAEQRTIPYEERFLRPNGQVPQSLLPASIAWHAENEYEANETTRARLQFLKASIEECSNVHLSDEDVKREMAKLPVPLRFRHLRSLKRCPFQYVASAQLGLFSKRSRWAWSSLASVVRRTNLNVSSAGALELALINSLNDELQDLQGTIPDDELEMVAISAPRVLRSFAQREFDAREKWELALCKQNASLDEAEMLSVIPDGVNTVVAFDARIDALYQTKDGDKVPMRLSSFSDDEFEEEAGLLLLLSRGNEHEYAAILDSVSSGKRRAIARGKDTSRTKFKNKGNLTVDGKRETTSATKSQAHSTVRARIQEAKSANVETRPGKHCGFCDFGSLCRSAPEGVLHTDPWEGLDDDESE